MRFYIFPVVDGKTVCVNFDHVSDIHIGPQTIELYVAGREKPMAFPKTPSNLATVAKGMDLSDNSKDQVNAL
jgi:hypothetical protein